MSINADLNTNQTTQDSVTYANKGVPLTQSVDKRDAHRHRHRHRRRGRDGGQHPGHAAATGSASKSNYNHTVTNTDFGVNKVVGHTQITPGAINSQASTSSFDKSVPTATQTAVRKRRRRRRGPQRQARRHDLHRAR